MIRLNSNVFAKNHSARSGAALVMSIVLLLVSTSICLSMFRTTALRQQRFVNRHWKLQTDLIADSALQRAQQQLKQDREYSGEVWKISIGRETGQANIQVKSIAANRYEATVVALYPIGIPQRIKTTVTAVVELPGKSSSEVGDSLDPLKEVK